MWYKRILLIIILSFIFVNVYALNDENIDVTVGDVDVPIYQVDVSWDSMNFSYNEQINYIWNSSTHTYELAESTYYWSNSNNTVTISNKSLNSINVNVQYKVFDQNIDGEFDVSSAILNYNDIKKFTLNLKGQLSSSYTEYVKVGSIALSIL